MIQSEAVVIPTASECLSLLKKHGVPVHIISHSRMVQGVALCLCRVLAFSGQRLDCALVEAGSLLHDIAKMLSLRTGQGHAQAGASLLLQLGYPEVAEIVRQHVVLDQDSPPAPITETALVHYADKRVQHTRVVTLGERFRDLKERYGKTPEALAWLEDLENRSLRLEEYLFRGLPIRPDVFFTLAAEWEREIEIDA